MIESPSTERVAPGVAEAYRALHLLPTAPRPLVTAVYQRLARDLAAAVRGSPQGQAQVDAFHAAYTTALAAAPPSPSNGHDAGDRTEARPWELLHVTQDAPPEIVAIAYECWRSGTREERSEAQAGPYDSADERLAALAVPRLDARPPRAPDGEARLVGEDERVFSIGAEPLRIGSDPTFDVVVVARPGRKHRVEARLWSHRGRFVLHVVDAPAAAVRVNGAPVVWAVLAHGDRLEVAGEPFRFERTDDGR